MKLNILMYFVHLPATCNECANYHSKLLHGFLLRVKILVCNLVEITYILQEL